MEIFADELEDKVKRELCDVRAEKHEEFMRHKQSVGEEESHDETHDDAYKLGEWEIHNNGFASKIMKKYGYGGKGLGKDENGIVKPIQAEKKSRFRDRE